MTRPGVVAPIVGATKPEQLQGNVVALDLALTPDQSARLDKPSVCPSASLYFFNADGNTRGVFGATVGRWDAG